MFLIYGGSCSTKERILYIHFSSLPLELISMGYLTSILFRLNGLRSILLSLAVFTHFSCPHVAKMVKSVSLTVQ